MQLKATSLQFYQKMTNKTFRVFRYLLFNYMYIRHILNLPHTVVRSLVRQLQFCQLLCVEFKDSIRVFFVNHQVMAIINIVVLCVIDANNFLKHV